MVTESFLRQCSLSQLPECSNYWYELPWPAFSCILESLGSQAFGLVQPRSHLTKSTAPKCQHLYSSPQISQGLLKTFWAPPQSMLQMLLGCTASGSPASWFFWNLQSSPNGSRNYYGSLSGALSAFTMKSSRLWPMSNSLCLCFGSQLHFTHSSSNIVEPNSQECVRAIWRLLTNLVIFIHSF